MSAALKSRYAADMQRMPRIREFGKVGKIVAHGPAEGASVPRRLPASDLEPRRRPQPSVRLAGAVLRFHVL